MIRVVARKRRTPSPSPDPPPPLGRSIFAKVKAFLADKLGR